MASSCSPVKLSDTSFLLSLGVDQQLFSIVLCWSAPQITLSPYLEHIIFHIYYYIRSIDCYTFQCSFFILSNKSYHFAMALLPRCSTNATCRLSVVWLSVLLYYLYERCALLQGNIHASSLQESTGDHCLLDPGQDSTDLGTLFSRGYEGKVRPPQWILQYLVLVAVIYIELYCQHYKNNLYYASHPWQPILSRGSYCVLRTTRTMFRCVISNDDVGYVPVIVWKRFGDEGSLSCQQSQMPLSGLIRWTLYRLMKNLSPLHPIPSPSKMKEKKFL